MADRDFTDGITDESVNLKRDDRRLDLTRAMVIVDSCAIYHHPDDVSVLHLFLIPHH